MQDWPPGKVRGATPAVMTLLSELPVRSPPQLPPDAARLLAAVQASGDGLTEPQARALLGAALPEAVQTLQNTWLLLAAPGAPSGKAARLTRFLAAPVMEPSTRLELTFAARRLSGRSGTLLALARHLDRSPGYTLGVMRTLVRAELASGGPVGATFVFRVSEMK